MAAIANIVVYDGASTPVLHTLIPISVFRQGTKVQGDWREQITSLPSYAQVSAVLYVEQLKSGVTKVEAKVTVPVMESISGQNAAGYTAAPKVAYTNTMTAVGFFHQRSTIADRRLTRQILANLLGNISTSVAAATTGYLPDAFDSLVAPT